MFRDLPIYMTELTAQHMETVFSHHEISQRIVKQVRDKNSIVPLR